MIFKFNISDTQSLVRQTFIESINKKYPVDIFWVDFTSCHEIQDNVTKKHNLIFYEDTIMADTVDVLIQTMNNHVDKKFYVFTDHYGLADLGKWPSNVQFVSYSIVGPIEDKNYRQQKLLLDKNFNSTKIGITLNRLPRPHRLCWISYLLGKNFDQHCVISAPLLKWHLEQKGRNIKDFLSWKDVDRSNDFGISVLQGWERAKKQEGLYIATDAYPPYNELVPSTKEFNNFENYISNLVPLYRDSFIEYITQTMYETPLKVIDEKYLNSQLGTNFPIILGAQGIIDFLRNKGFDMFDDIINNDHDTESDPRLRMQSAFINNKHLFENFENTKKLWEQNKPRFQHNVDLFLKMCKGNAEEEFKKIFDRK